MSTEPSIETPSVEDADRIASALEAHSLVLAARITPEIEAATSALRVLGRRSHSEFVAHVNKGKEFPPEIKAMSDEAVHYANDNDTILSLLYDMDLMPEQLEEGSFRWGQMINVIDHFKQAIAQARASKGAPGG